MTASTAPKPRYAARDFNDAGTGRSFKQGEPVDAEAGELANYEAAGLLGDKADVPAPTADDDGANTTT